MTRQNGAASLHGADGGAGGATERGVSRRRLLLVGLGLTLPASAAFAFSEEAPTAKLAGLHQAACGPTEAHQAFLAEVEKTLGDKLTEQEKRDILAQITCPVCGCLIG